jgi:hypothetical protein
LNKQPDSGETEMKRSKLLGVLVSVTVVTGCSNVTTSTTKDGGELLLADLVSAHLYRELKIEAHGTSTVFAGSGEELEKSVGSLSCLQDNYFDEMEGRSIVSTTCTIKKDNKDKIVDEESASTLVGKTAQLIYDNLSVAETPSTDVMAGSGEILEKIIPGTLCSSVSSMDEKTGNDETVYSCSFSKDFSNEKISQKLAKIQQVPCVRAAEQNREGGIPEFGSTLLPLPEILVLTKAESNATICSTEVVAAANVELIEIQGGKSFIVK